MFFFFPFLIFGLHLVAYGSAQARGRIRASAANLQYGYCNLGSDPCLRPTPQLRWILNSRIEPIKPASTWTLVRFISTEPQRELPICFSLRKQIP